MTLRRLLGSPLAALSSLSLLAVWPLLRAGYPSIGDGLNHLYRLVEFDHLLRHGAWFPRWATDLGYGYGYPLFNYYPPLAYYGGALFHALGLNFAHSLLAVYVVAIALAVTGAYTLAHERWGHAGGLIAAWAYGLSPYLYFNVLARGALPETLGLGLLPWALWAYYCLARKPCARLWAAATLLYSGLILSHLLSGLIAAPLILVFALFSESGRVRARRRPKSETSDSVFKSGSRHKPQVELCFLRFTFLSFLFSLLLSSFFLLPAVLETGYVRIDQLTLPGDLDFHNNFLTLGELFAWPQSFDPRLVFVAVPPSLSLAALALALSGLLLRLWAALRHRTSSLQHWDLALGITFLLLCLLTLPITVPLWERLPFANLIQFPWRLVGPASLLLALLAASASPLRPLTSRRSPGVRLWDLGVGIYFFLPLTGISPSTIARMSFSLRMSSFLPSSLISVPAYLANSTTSPTETSIEMRLPSSSRPPGPTALISPFCGFSLAVSGRTIPEGVISSPSRGSTTTRSPSGLRFIAIFYSLLFRLRYVCRTACILYTRSQVSTLKGEC